MEPEKKVSFDGSVPALEDSESRQLGRVLEVSQKRENVLNKIRAAKAIHKVESKVYSSYLQLLNGSGKESAAASQE